MSLVSYRCPTTRGEVTTTIEARQDTLSRMKAMNLKILVWCPHCLTSHQIKASDAVVHDEDVRSKPDLVQG